MIYPVAQSRPPRLSLTALGHSSWALLWLWVHIVNILFSLCGCKATVNSNLSDRQINFKPFLNQRSETCMKHCVTSLNIFFLKGTSEWLCEKLGFPSWVRSPWCNLRVWAGCWKPIIFYLMKVTAAAGAVLDYLVSSLSDCNVHCWPIMPQEQCCLPCNTVYPSCHKSSVVCHVHCLPIVPQEQCCLPCNTVYQSCHKSSAVCHVTLFTNHATRAVLSAM